MDREKILRSYMRRRCDGSLAYPRTVYAHLEEIKKIAPDFLTEKDYTFINYIKTRYDKRKFKNRTI